MQQEIIKKILEAEETADKIKRQAITDAKNIIAEQKVNANQIMWNIDRDARTEYEKIIEKAKEEALIEIKLLKKHANDNINAMTNGAKGKMDKAVKIIVDKVVSIK